MEHNYQHPKRQKLDSQRSQPTTSVRVRSTREVEDDEAPQSSQQSFLFSQDTRGTSVAGVLKTLTLQNFMCHSNFTHEFHSNLNFITGQNGSGKSALLSGILVALGGKASVTSRTNSLKTLIQKGKHTFRVAVTLLNKNGLSRYGDEVTIERWVNQSGSGGYRIKSVGGADEDNHWRTLKKPELESILLGLNIQIDNPVAILNQEVARSFLRSKDPKVKFNLFYEGTLLSKLEEVLGDTRKELDETKGILKQHVHAIHAVKKEICELKSKVEKIEELKSMKEKFRGLHTEYLWAVVIQYEKEQENAEAAVAKNQKEIDVLSKKFEETRESLTRLSEESIVEEQNEVRRRLLEKKKEFDSIRVELVGLKKDYSNLRLQLKSAQSTVQAKETQIAQLSARLEALKNEQQAREADEALEDQEKLAELQERKKHLESAAATVKLDADNFLQAGEGAREKLQEIQNQENALKTQIESRKRDIANLGTGGNKYAAFGPRMQELMMKIEANKSRFRKPPRGPLGACFRVKDPQFVVLVEGVLKNFLDNFVVDNGRDLNLLRGLINSVYELDASQQRRQSGRPPGRSPGIIMSPFADRMYDISRHIARVQGVPTLFDLIEAENNDHIVINALIDVGEIERILLFKSNESACQIMKDESRCPPSLKVGYSLQWYRFSPAPWFAARVMQRLGQAHILKSGRDREALKRDLADMIVNLQSELRELEPAKVEINREVRGHQSKYDQKMEELQKTRRKLGEVVNELKRHLDKIKEKKKRYDFTSFVEELEETKEELATHIANRDEFTKKLEPIRPRLEELEDKKQQLVDEVENLNTHLAGFAEARDKLKSRRAEIENILKKIQTKLNNIQDIKDKLGQELRKCEANVAEKKRAAENQSKKRIETKKSPEELRSQFDCLKVNIEATENQLGDQEALRNKLKFHREKYSEMMRDYGPLLKMHGLLQKILDEQNESFSRMKAHMGRTLTIFFAMMAKQRGYEGRLLVDFETKELYYFVCPDGDSAHKTIKAIDAQQSQRERRNSDQAKQNKQLKKALVEYSLGLSGGERSFATICFIMSLWQVMECPFYMLDEFDVFMDAFNRKTSQQALMAHAKKFRMHQFILFTPLDLGELPGPEDAKVLRLYPPVRGGSGGGRNAPSSQGGDGGAAGQSGGSRRGGRGRTNRNSDDCVENMDPVVPSQGKEGGDGRGKRKNHSSQVLATPN